MPIGIPIQEQIQVTNVPGQNLDVLMGDQTTPPLDLFFLRSINFTTTASPTTEDSKTLIVSDATYIDTLPNESATIGSWLGIVDPDSGRFYFGEVVVKNGTTLTMDCPFDFAFAAGKNVIIASRELNVAGTPGSPVVFSVRGVGSGVIEIDITRIMMQMVTDSAANYGMFGNIAGGLTYGICLRLNNGVKRNVWNAKTNDDLGLLAYDLNIFGSANPQGVDGVGFRYTFAGQDKHGVAVRLAPGDQLDLWIQDDLTDLSSYRAMAQGHIVLP